MFCLRSLRATEAFPLSIGLALFEPCTLEHPQVSEENGLGRELGRA